MKRFVAILLSTLMLVSTMGFTVSTHYCGGKAIKSHLTLGKSALSCGMKKTPRMCNSDSQHEMTKKGCCENKYLSIDLDDDYQPVIADIDINVEFVFTFVYTYVQLIYFDVDREIAFSDYSPPPVRQDIQVLYQTFLI